MTAKQLIHLELNELNFDIIYKYICKFPGSLLGFELLFKLHQVILSSEANYDELEPWIQWISVHTGLTYKEHGVYRLGDIVNQNTPQVFEIIESKGWSVAALSPMNAANNLQNPIMFIPDPWTTTKSDNSKFSIAFSKALKQAVNQNSQSKLTIVTCLTIIYAIMKYASYTNYGNYIYLLITSFRFKWRRALFLDLLLSDIFFYTIKYQKVNFFTLFLNAGAHIQHHYFFNSKVISDISKVKNPNWYVSENQDPLYEVLVLYNKVLLNLFREIGVDYIVSTGLSQVPYDRVKYYYRLINHEDFLRMIGIFPTQVKTRMTRDFLIEFSNDIFAKDAEEILKKIKFEHNNHRMFESIDNRGSTLFVTLTYPYEIKEIDKINVNNLSISIFQHVCFVAIKNGMHVGKSYSFFSKHLEPFAPKNNSHVKSIFSTIVDYFETSNLCGIT